MPRKNRRIQIQTETLSQVWKPTDKPTPQGPPEAFDLGLAETPEVIQNRIVTRKALHAREIKDTLSVIGTWLINS
jgi:hypothetical protein